jgi:hypothetical protein
MKVSMSTTGRLSRWILFAAAPALAAVIAGCGARAASEPTATPSGGDSRPRHTLPNNPTLGSTLPINGQAGYPVTYARGGAEPRAPLTPDAAATQVMNSFSHEPQLVGITTTSTSSGLDLAITLRRNDGRVPDMWLADLAVGAVAELVHSDETVAKDLISSAIASGPGKGGDPVTTDLGVGAVRLGQLFGSPTDSALSARVADIAKHHGLEVADLLILHPFESALSVKLVVPTGAPIDWTIEELRSALVGPSPDVEGVLIELDDSDGQQLLPSAVAYRTGEGGLWFAPGQDERFGAVHGGMPGTRSGRLAPEPAAKR